MIKEVCQKCYKEHDAIWSKSDDLRWSRGEVSCWMHSWCEVNLEKDRVQWRPNSSYALDESSCPYFLEHLILDQGDIEGG